MLLDELHVVLDHHQRMLALERQEQLGGALGLLVGHAGHRLVEQQQLRVLHQQHADLQPLLLAVRQQAGDASALSFRWISVRVRRCGRAAVVDKLRKQRRPHAACRPSARARGSRTRVSCSNTVGFWNLRPMPTCAICASAQAQQVDGRAEERRARVGPRLAGDHVHHRRLAGAVGADDAAQLAGVDRSDSLFSALKPSKLTRDVSR